MNNYSFKNDYFKKKNTDYKKNSVTTLYEHNPPPPPNKNKKKTTKKQKHTHRAVTGKTFSPSIVTFTKETVIKTIFIVCTFLLFS